MDNTIKYELYFYEIRIMIAQASKELRRMFESEPIWNPQLEIAQASKKLRRMFESEPIWNPQLEIAQASKKLRKIFESEPVWNLEEEIHKTSAAFGNSYIGTLEQQILAEAVCLCI